LFTKVIKKDGSEYEPDSLWVMIVSLDCHLKEAGSNISIAKESLPTVVKYLKRKLASSVNRATVSIPVRQRQ